MQIRKETDRYHTLESGFEAVDDLCARFVERVIDQAGYDERYGESDVERIANRHYSGFIPYKNGGWQGTVYCALSTAHGSGYGPRVIQDIIERSLDDAAKEFEEQTSIDPNILYEFSGGPWDSLGYKMLERWYEWQDTWLSEGGTYFYYARAYYHDADNSHNSTGEDEVYFLAGINLDLDYGRDNIPWLTAYGSDPQQSKWSFKRTVKVSEITPELIDKMAKEALASL